MRLYVSLWYSYRGLLMTGEGRQQAFLLLVKGYDTGRCDQGRQMKVGHCDFSEMMMMILVSAQGHRGLRICVRSGMIKLLLLLMEKKQICALSSVALWLCGSMLSVGCWVLGAGCWVLRAAPRRCFAAAETPGSIEQRQDSQNVN